MCSRGASECRPGVGFPSYPSCCSLHKFSRVPRASYSFKPGLELTLWQYTGHIPTTKLTSSSETSSSSLTFQPPSYQIPTFVRTNYTALFTANVYWLAHRPGVFFFFRLYLNPERLFSSRFLFVSPNKDSTCLWTGWHTVSCKVAMKHWPRSFIRTSKTETASSFETSEWSTRLHDVTLRKTIISVRKSLFQEVFIFFYWSASYKTFLSGLCMKKYNPMLPSAKIK